MDADCRSVRATFASSGKKESRDGDEFLVYLEDLERRNTSLQTSPSKLLIVGLPCEVTKLLSVDRKESFVVQFVVVAAKLIGINVHKSLGRRLKAGPEDYIGSSGW